jgi:transcriptional regulator with XRE-family HTH domain
MNLKGDFISFLKGEMRRQHLTSYGIVQRAKKKNMSVSHSTVQRILGGEMSPTLDVCNAICVALGKEFKA